VGHNTAIRRFDAKKAGQPLDLFEAAEILLEQRIRLGIQAAAQGGDQRAQGGNGVEVEGLGVGQTPLVQSGDQHRQAQQAALVAFSSLAPVDAAPFELGENLAQLFGVGGEGLTEDPGENILGQPGGSALDIGVGQGSERIVGNAGGGGHRNSRRAKGKAF